MANLISLLRAFLAIPIIYTLTDQRWLPLTFVLVVVAILSDALDGFFARRSDQVTHFGKMLDPLADSVLIISVTFYIVLDPGRNFPGWFLIFFLIRYLSIALFALYLLNHSAGQLGANKVGKISVTFTAITIALYIFNFPALETARILFLWITVILQSVSWVQYLLDYKRQYQKI